MDDWGLDSAANVQSDHQGWEDGKEACFLAFNNNRNGLLDKNEFTDLCRALFKNDKGCSYYVPQCKIDDMFSIFDVNKDGYIDSKEFDYCWDNWIQKIVHPVAVFLIVDMQNDFISGTLSLSNCPAKQNAEEIISPINVLLDTCQFDRVFYSLDWHPSNHISFFDNVHQRKVHSSSSVSAEKAQVYDTVVFEGPPLRKQRLWPRHCVEGSWGAELHSQLKDNEKLSETALSSELRKINATDVYVCGLAYDVCVGASAADALARGYRTILVEDCSRGVDLRDIEETRNTILSGNGVIVDSSHVKCMTEGKDRRPELGYKLAMVLKNLTQTH